MNRDDNTSAMSGDKDMFWDDLRTQIFEKRVVACFPKLAQSSKFEKTFRTDHTRYVCE